MSALPGGCIGCIPKVAYYLLEYLLTHPMLRLQVIYKPSPPPACG